MRYVIATALVTISLAASAAEPVSIDAAVRVHMEKTKTPGVAIAVVRGESVAYAKGFGVATAGGTTPITAETLFQIGSVTKAITAATVMSLAHDGKLKLDVPVSRYLSGLSSAIGAVTLDQLLSQTSGLRDEPAEYGSHDEAALAAYPRTWTNAYAILPPGTSFSYSNPGYTLAGAVAQKVAGKPFADLVAERVFTPLGMSHSTFRPTEAMLYPLAVGHTGKRGEAPERIRSFADDTRHWPAGYVYTSVRDLARFAAALLNRGRVDGKQAIPAEIVVAMLTPRASVPNNLSPAQYGYGLFIEPYGGSLNIWHPGEMPGFSALMRIFPEQKLAMVIVANREGVRHDAIGDAILASEHVAITNSIEKPPATLPMSAAEMRSYAGRYVNRFPVEIFVRDDALWIRRPDGEHELKKIGPNRFTTDATRAFHPAEVEIYPASASHPAYLMMYLWSFAKE